MRADNEPLIAAKRFALSLKGREQREPSAVRGSGSPCLRGKGYSRADFLSSSFSLLSVLDYKTNKT